MLNSAGMGAQSQRSRCAISRGILTLKEIDEIIYAVCTLCRDHEKAGFIEGIKVGMSLANEVNIP